MRKIQKDRKRIPLKLSEGNALQRLHTCIAPLARQKRKSFFWKIVTGDKNGLP